MGVDIWEGLKAERVAAALEEQNENLEWQNFILTRMAGNMGALDGPGSWGEIQALVRAGMIGMVVQPGDQLTAEIGSTTYDFDVLGIDEDEPVNPALNHVLSIQMHSMLSQLPFDPAQYLVAVTAEALTAWGISGNVLPAGTYNVTLDHGAYNGNTAEDGTYQFTTTQDIPIGGGIRHSYMGTYQSNADNYTKANVLAGTFTTYGADTLTVIESGLSTTEGNSGVNLGTAAGKDPTYKSGNFINFTQRQRYGSNRWSTSYIRQFLNSDEAALVFAPATIFSRDYSTAPEGFRHSLDSDLQAVLTKVRKRYALPIADGYGYEDVEDYVTLDTMLDILGSQNNGISEGAVDAGGNVTRTTAYAFWRDRSTSADRIKYDGSAAHDWWIGSCAPYEIGLGRIVNTSGTLAIVSSSGSQQGIVPSLHIG